MSKGLVLSQKVYLPMEAMDGTPYMVVWNQSSSQTTLAVDSWYGGVNTITGYASFASSSWRQVMTNILLPDDVYLSAGVAIKICWASSDVSGNIVWRVSTAFAAQNSQPDPAFNTVQTIQDHPCSSASYGLRMVTKSGLTTTGAAAGSQMWIKIARDPAASSSDTMPSSAALFGVEMTYSRMVTLI